MRFSSFLLVSCLTSLTVAGCAVAGAEGADSDSTSEALQGGVPVVNPAGTYAVKVTALGSGCPAGTWDPTMSADGKVLTIQFDGYELYLAPQQVTTVKDCTLMIDLGTRANAAFAVRSVNRHGIAWLDSKGMTARASVRTYFQGLPAAPADVANVVDDYQGDFDSSASFTDANEVWSPCGRASRLIMQTRMMIVNNRERTGSGWLNPMGEDFDTSVKLRIELDSKKC